MELDEIEDNYKQEVEQAALLFKESIVKGESASAAEKIYLSSIKKSRGKYYSLINAYLEKERKKKIPQRNLTRVVTKPFKAEGVSVLPNQEDKRAIRFRIALFKLQLFFGRLFHLIVPPYFRYILVRVNKFLGGIRSDVVRVIKYDFNSIINLIGRLFNWIKKKAVLIFTKLKDSIKKFVKWVIKMSSWIFGLIRKIIPKRTEKKKEDGQPSANVIAPAAPTTPVAAMAAGAETPPSSEAEKKEDGKVKETEVKLEEGKTEEPKKEIKKKKKGKKS